MEAMSSDKIATSTQRHPDRGMYCTLLIAAIGLIVLTVPLTELWAFAFQWAGRSRLSEYFMAVCLWAIPIGGVTASFRLKATTRLRAALAGFVCGLGCSLAVSFCLGAIGTILLAKDEHGSPFTAWFGMLLAGLVFGVFAGLITACLRALTAWPLARECVVPKKS